MRLFHSWNEAFELAGNSYAASGHFFHELYRYSDWILTMPLLLLELVLIADSKKNNSLLQQLIGSALLSIFFTYFGASNFAERGAWMRWSGWGLSVIFFLYMAWKLIAEVSINPTEQADLERKFFLKARNLFLLSWSFYPLATLGILCHHGLGEVELMIFLMSSGIADFASKCGVSFYLYRAAKVSSQKFRGTLTK